MLVGSLYSYALYSTIGPWNKLINIFLGVARFLSVSILCFLLLGPFLKQLFNSTEEPTFIFAIDDSMSIIQSGDSIQYRESLREIQKLSSELSDKGYQIASKTISGSEISNIELVQNVAKFTDLNLILKSIQSDYEGKNIGGVLLVSDGIYNQGLSPNFSPFNFKIHTLGLGDTIPREDITLKNIYYNNLAYQGNKFPIVVEVINSGFTSNEVIVRVLKDGQEIDRSGVRFSADNQLKQVSFTLDAETNGLQHYRLEVIPIEGESSYSNNTKDAYIDIIEGKEKILLVGLAPHPDIKAIASTIENNENYELQVFIPGIEEFKEDKYDLVIFHQAFDRFNRNNQLVQKFLKSETPIWFIAGNQSNINAFNQLNGLVKISITGNNKDLVRPAHNRGFTRFKLNSEDYQATLTDYPPVVVPFGKTELTEGGEVLLYQQVGSIVTNKPLLAVHESGGKKIAVMVGEGFWQWRTMEYATKDGHETFDEMVLKLIQFLSAKEDKRKFRVYPLEDQFDDTEDIVFETEVYNAIYEPIYGNEVQLSITDEAGDKVDYTYSTSNTNTQFKIRGLSQGVYKYTASTLLNGNLEVSSGEFSVSELQIETLNLTANHSVLRKLSKDSGGKFFLSSELEQLKQTLFAEEPQGIIYTSETFLPLINLKWIFFLILLLLSAEWFTRKYSGGY